MKVRVFAVRFSVPGRVQRSLMVLDNPFWSALTTEQAAFAQAGGGMRWFPGEVGPFCAIERAGHVIDPDVMRAAFDGCAMRYFAGVLPILAAGFHVSRPIALLQMACTAIRDA